MDDRTGLRGLMCELIYYPHPGIHDSWYFVPRGKHARSRRRFMFSTAMAMAGMLLAVFAIIPPAHAAENLGAAGLDWAEAHAVGCWYNYGGTNCAQGYDCSGLVSSSILNATGVSIGRDTYDMLDNPHLHRVPLDDIQRGDLLFFGSGHVSSPRCGTT